MDDLLELLIDSLDTVDGCRNSAIPIKQKIHDIKFKREHKRQLDLQKRKEMKDISFFDDNKVRQMSKLTPSETTQVKRTTQIKYKIMRVRAKISFIAF